jgi:tetratricopeptide (TPR) repeat protein
MGKTRSTAFRTALWGAASGLALALAYGAPPAIAQQTEDGPGGRWKVLVVPLRTEGLDRRFGERVAREVIDALKNFPTHTAIPETELRKACKTYGVKCEELNAITSRQMAAQLRAQVVMFGTVAPGANGGYRVEARFTDVKTGEEIQVPPIAIAGEKEVEKVAGAIVSTFERAVNFQRARFFCQEYTASRQPRNALENCTRALEISPNSSVALYHKGTAFRQLAEEDSAKARAWFDSAIAYYRHVLDVQPGHKDALQSLAWVYTQLGNTDEAMRLYREFLSLDPDNVTVRLAVAHDLAQDGLTEEAIQVLNEGIDRDPSKIELWQYKADLALRLAQDKPAYADTAIVAYRRVYETRGAEADTTILTNLLAAYATAGRFDEALAFGRQAVQTHGGSASLWSQYAVAFSKAKRFEEAAQALVRVLEIDPNYPNVYVRRGLYRLYGGNTAAAKADFQQAMQRGEIGPDQLATNLFAEGYQAFTREKDLDRAERLYALALEYCRDAKRCGEIHFFWGYALYSTGAELDKRDDLPSIRRALELFQKAKPLIERGRSARPKEASEILEHLDVFIVREEARIKAAQRS